jgi:hypothetical protein
LSAPPDDDVLGWFNSTDALLLSAFDELQGRRGVTGDVLEIGIYRVTSSSTSTAATCTRLCAPDIAIARACSARVGSWCSTTGPARTCRA